MSRIIKSLIDQNPKEAKFKYLWELTAWDKRFNSVPKEKQPVVYDYHYFLANELKNLIVKNGDVKILTTSTTDFFTTEELVGDYFSEREVVAIPWGGNPNVQYYSGKFITGDNRIASSLDTTVLNNKYLYYFMQSKLNEIGSFYRGSGIKHPDMAKVLDLRIPVPPLEVQQEIASVLDKFIDFSSNLTDKLTAELAARRTQLSYYREQLIKTSSNKKEKLSDVVDIYIGLTATPNYVESGVKFISAQNTSSDYLDLENVKYISFEDYKKATKNAKPKRGDLLFTRVGSNLGHPIIVDTDEELCIFVSLGFLRIKNKSELIVDYLKHWMNTSLFWDQVKKNVHGAAKVNLNTGWLKDFLIPLPSYEFQQSIISELNRLEILCTSLTISLPAEIAARQKQYEYYRDKLLSFKELNA